MRGAMMTPTLSTSAQAAPQIALQRGAVPPRRKKSLPYTAAAAHIAYSRMSHRINKSADRHLKYAARHVPCICYTSPFVVDCSCAVLEAFIGCEELALLTLTIARIPNEHGNPSFKHYRDSSAPLSKKRLLLS